MPALPKTPAYHAGNHYENFPVGSWLIPSPMRPAVIALYRFARTADDIADEGSASATDRQEALDRLRRGLFSPSETGNAAQRLAVHLNTIRSGQKLALDLLSAFEGDCTHRAMDSDAMVLAYCSRSANPVGRLMLGFAGLDLDDPNESPILNASDYICTGLQLANFAQDLGEDLARKKIYFPQGWAPAGWNPDQGLSGLDDSLRISIANRLADWALRHLRDGAQLPARLRRRQLPGMLRVALEIGLTIAGGEKICRLVKRNPARVWHESPRISAWHLPHIFISGASRIW